jgi:hypothetical protein
LRGRSRKSDTLFIRRRTWSTHIRLTLGFILNLTATNTDEDSVVSQHCFGALIEISVRGDDEEKLSKKHCVECNHTGFFGLPFWPGLLRLRRTSAILSKCDGKHNSECDPGSPLLAHGLVHMPLALRFSWIAAG